MDKIELPEGIEIIPKDKYLVEPIAPIMSFFEDADGETAPRLTIFEDE